MAIDHGLGGKNSERKQKQKQKRNHKMMSLAKAASVVNSDKPLIGKIVVNRKEIVFDDAARVEWLTGFRKRKTERRKYGLTMQILKDKKTHKEKIKAKRETVKNINSKRVESVSNIMNGVASNGDNDNNKEEEEEKVFTDGQTVSMFGGSVSVVIGNTNLDAGDDEIPMKYKPEINNDSDNDDDFDNDSDNDSHSVRSSRSINQNNKNNHKGNQLTKFEKAYREVGRKGLMTKKKTYNNAKKDKKGNVIATGKRLFDKAIGKVTKIKNRKNSSK